MGPAVARRGVMPQLPVNPYDVLTSRMPHPQRLQRTWRGRPWWRSPHREMQCG